MAAFASLASAASITHGVTLHMWKSRQTAVRQLDGVSLQSAIEAARRAGFEQYTERDDRALMKKPGTSFTLSASKTPLKLALVQQAPPALELRLRYDAFVLFDTGDLEDEADRIAEAVGASATI